MSTSLMEVHPSNSEFQKWARECAVRSHKRSVEERGGYRTPKFGMTAIIGEMGCGKTSVASWLLTRKYMQGYQLYATADAGFAIGNEISMAAGNLHEFFAFAANDQFRGAYIFIDEIGNYLDRFAQNSITHRGLMASMWAGLRKFQCHIVFTAQSDMLLSDQLRSLVKHVLYPEHSPGIWGRKRGEKRGEFHRRAGKYSDFKRGVWELKGEKALTFDQKPNVLMQIKGVRYPKPRRRFFQVPYQQMIFACAMFDTLADLVIMPGTEITAQEQKERGFKQRRAKASA